MTWADRRPQAAPAVEHCVAPFHADVRQFRDVTRDLRLVAGQLFAMASEKIITVQTFTSLYSMAGGLLSKFLAAGAAAVKLAGL